MKPVVMCHHMIHKKKQARRYFVMHAGLNFVLRRTNFEV